LDRYFSHFIRNNEARPAEKLCVSFHKSVTQTAQRIPSSDLIAFDRVDSFFLLSTRLLSSRVLSCARSVSRSIIDRDIDPIAYRDYACDKYPRSG